LTARSHSRLKRAARSPWPRLRFAHFGFPEKAIMEAEVTELTGVAKGLPAVPPV
jgi:hypothetical protein